MGEVYRARDSRLDRTVAIKILATHLASSPDLKQRFEREARTLSSLSHPNICHLYDIGSQDGVDFLVMEFLEGETLAHRLQRGELPLNEVMRIGMEVAGALHVAHRAGIVHRDLKPGNVMLTKSGTKLMDFGLAKPAALAASASGSAPLLSAAMTASGPSPASPLTSAGTVIGTIQYMSPEQISGQAADARSDIFALGAVLYEMATGSRPFEGKSQISVASAILEKDPEPVSRVRAVAPPAFDQLVKDCLEKSPEDRIQTAHDVRLQLKWIAAGEVGVPPRAASPTMGRERRLWMAIAALLFLAAVVLGAAWWQARTPPSVIRATLLPPEGTQYALLNRNGPAALSPDGRRIAFVASREGKTSLWVRSLDRLDAKELPGTNGAFFPFWSPDEGSLGFFANGKMWRMDANGGSQFSICDAANGRGASWGANDTIIFAPNISTAIYRVAAGGGTPTPVTTLAHIGRGATGGGANVADESNRWPSFLPDGKHFIYLMTHTGAGDDESEIRYASVDGGKEKTLLRGRYYLPAYASGWLLTVRNGVLAAQKFNPSTGTLSGEPVQVAEHVHFDDLVAASVFSASQTGRLVFEEGGGTAGERVVLADARGRELAQVLPAGVYGKIRLSPDGSRISLPEDIGTDLWTVDLKRGTNTRISFGGKFTDSSAWSPDGREIYFNFSDGSGPLAIYERPADGSRPQKKILASGYQLFVADVTPDGKYLLYEETTPAGLTALKAFPLTASGQAFTVLESLEGLSNGLSSGGGTNARVSPDNGWLAYQSGESGRSQVYITKFPKPAGQYQVSLDGGIMPVWGRDGKRLFYLDPSQKMMAVDVQLGKESVQIGKPAAIFQTGVRASLGGNGFDVTRDGGFLLINSIGESSTPLTLVTTWDSELKK